MEGFKSLIVILLSSVLVNNYVLELAEAADVTITGATTWSLTGKLTEKD